MGNRTDKYRPSGTHLGEIDLIFLCVCFSILYLTSIHFTNRHKYGVLGVHLGEIKLINMVCRELI